MISLSFKNTIHLQFFEPFSKGFATKAFQCLSKLYNVPDAPTLSRISTTSFNRKISYHLLSMIIIINQI